MTRAFGLLLIAALVGAACGTDGPDGPAATGTANGGSTAGPAEVAPIEIDRGAAVAAAIDVRADGCGPRVGFGTGTVIAGGDIVTAAHVVAGANSVEVIDVDGDRSSAAVVVFDPDIDFAVLRPSIEIGTPIDVRATQARRGEDGVLVRVRELVDQIDVVEIEVSVVREANISTTDIYRDRDVVRDGFEIQSAVDPGDSGAMVVLPGGGVGIVWARSNVVDSRAWAIDLPAGIIDGTTLDGPVEPVSVGTCLR